METNHIQNEIDLPEKTEIRYSTSTNNLLLAVSLGFMVAGVYLLKSYTDKVYMFFGFFLVFLGAHRTFKNWKRMRDKSPKIVIDDKGIATFNSGFNSWENISNEEVVMEMVGRSSKACLKYNFGAAATCEKILIDELDVSFKDLEAMLQEYRIRNKNLTKSEN
ncbi:hypothetical protein [Neptunitalea lumnitzerae]|uniref:Uncharacterized protein n=1 Tax=Neptunitalea lumnitzerae TaxID=2965509 RepID=A0ABQ5MIB0_9FLAO|nr:hypothetical protein [Neptunitalea sp. Y10]GLB49128.1 hypothetical protein Y10_14960 [Neptunitalea sp. Y10]